MGAELIKYPKKLCEPCDHCRNGHVVLVLKINAILQI